MKTKIIGLLFSVLITNFTFAQNARAILDNASETYSKAGTISARFTIESNNTTSNTIYSSDGTAYMKGLKFKIDIPEATTWFDGKTQWVYLKDVEEVNISNPEGADLQGISPAILFSVYKSGYDLKYLGEKNVGGKTIQEVELKAQKKNADISKIIVYINKTTNMFSKIAMHEKAGMINTLIISSYQTNNSLPDATFTFNKKDYPNVEIVDLR